MLGAIVLKAALPQANTLPRKVLSHMLMALQLLDDAGSAGDVAAHLDLTVDTLQARSGKIPPPRSHRN